MRLPHGCEENVGILRIKDDVNATGLFVLIENFLPGFSAIHAAENSPLRIRSVGVAKCRDEYDVGVVRINDDRADVPRIRQAYIRPRLSRIERFVYAVAVGNIAADASFARARINYVRVGFGNGDASNRGDRFIIENRKPRESAVRGLPNAASYSSKIKNAGISGNADGRERSSAAKRPDLPPLQALQMRFIHVLRPRHARAEKHARHDCRYAKFRYQFRCQFQCRASPIHVPESPEVQTQNPTFATEKNKAIRSSAFLCVKRC